MNVKKTQIYVHFMDFENIDVEHFENLNLYLPILKHHNVQNMLKWMVL